MTTASSPGRSRPQLQDDPEPQPQAWIPSGDDISPTVQDFLSLLGTSAAEDTPSGRTRRYDNKDGLRGDKGNKGATAARAALAMARLKRTLAGR